MKIEHRNGPEFVEAEPAEVIDFLRGRQVQKVKIPPENAHIVNDGKEFYLHCSHNGLKEYPLRDTFLTKVFRWYNVPRRLMAYLDIDTITSILNDLLLNINSDHITVTIEDGDALTITSPHYSELSDLDAIKMCEPLGIRRISRNDFFMRIDSCTKFDVEPNPGDVCGFGYNVLNSETGFRALSLNHFILRYVCSNGAVVRQQGHLRRRIHYGFNQGELFRFLEESIIGGKGGEQQIVGRLADSVRIPLHGEENVVASLDSVLGKGRGKAITRSLPSIATKYDLFNAITECAKSHPIGIRLQLEIIAGELLSGEQFRTNS